MKVNRPPEFHSVTRRMVVSEATGGPWSAIRSATSSRSRIAQTTADESAASRSADHDDSSQTSTVRLWANDEIAWTASC